MSKPVLVPNVLEGNASMKMLLAGAAGIVGGALLTRLLTKSASGTSDDSLYAPFYTKVLEVMPAEWRGTTFNNSTAIYIGRNEFLKKVIALQEAKTPDQLTEKDFKNLGNSEDYLRVGTNICTVLELALAQEKGLADKNADPVAPVITFGSKTMPFISVMLTLKNEGKTVQIISADGADVFSSDDLKHLKDLDLTAKQGGKPVAGNILLKSVAEGAEWGSVAGFDGLVQGHVLYILNLENIKFKDVYIMRKRMATPVTSPVAENMLRKLACLPRDSSLDAPSAAERDEFFTHLQTMSGTAGNMACKPIIFTAGLPALCSLFVALIKKGPGADIVMCSTAYGGSSQLNDLLGKQTGKHVKHTFSVQGDLNVDESITSKLKELQARPKKDLQPIMVLFVEIPTNPDMKVPQVSVINDAVTEYEQKTGTKVMVLVDVTFAPASKVMEKFASLNKDLPVMVFVSMSKSVSRGETTAGGLIANHTEYCKEVLDATRASATLLDTQAKPDQMKRLCKNHKNVEKRCSDAYKLACDIGTNLQAAVKQHTGEDMELAFVKPEHAEQGFTSSTYSFNLPAFKGANMTQKNAELAQKFVDHLTDGHPTVFKPCVSFGQDNGLVYATVPATSTQGAIKAEDKAKQEKGGVQLTRLSFPAQQEKEADLAKINKIVDTAVAEAYVGFKK